jgi:hypothetical protein
MLNSFEKLQRASILTGLFLSAFLLIKFAIDFSAETTILLALPFWLLVLAALAVGFSNLFVRQPSPSATHSKRSRLLLLVAMPLAFLASSLDCSGLSLMGCSPYCTFIKTTWIPLIAIASGAYYFVARSWLLFLLSVMSFAALVPHCVCYNMGNGWWIERLGASPVCYAWGFVVSMISIGALLAARRALPSLIISGAIICGALGFFVAHHYFHFPW